MRASLCADANDGASAETSHLYKPPLRSVTLRSETSLLFDSLTCNITLVMIWGYVLAGGDLRPLKRHLHCDCSPAGAPWRRTDRTPRRLCTTWRRRGCRCRDRNRSAIAPSHPACDTAAGSRAPIAARSTASLSPTINNRTLPNTPKR